MNIVLIGFMGCGKSAVAPYLSALLGFTCVEMDDLVYRKTNTRTMKEVFAKGGEFLLRETEIAIAREYAVKAQLVISTGAGVVLNKIILDYFTKAGGKILFLHTPFEQIVKRIQKDDARPLFRDVATLKQLYDFRLPLYFQYADEVIDVGSCDEKAIALRIQGGLLHGF